MLTRRNFLQRVPLVALAPHVPAFLAQTAMAAGADRDERILVVVQLEGGNDGLNTVVPFGDDGYARNRRQLRLPADRLIRVGDGVGLHPRMIEIGQKFDDGQVAIVQGVGYPNPSRSHFRSMAIWQSGNLDAIEGVTSAGWLGESVGQKSRASQAKLGADIIYVGGGDVPVACRGRRCTSIAMTDASEMTLRDGTGTVENRGNSQGDSVATSSDREDVSSFVNQSVLQAYASAQEVAMLSDARSASAQFGSQLNAQLQWIADMIKAGAGARVYYTSQPGYDTHANQLSQHAGLLGDLSQSTAAFVGTLRDAGLGDQVLVMVFSEFGRRVEENGSEGTDHGTAGPVFLIGDAVHGGLHGASPSLDDLEDGDLKFEMDFRNIYATVIDRWLDVPRPDSLLG
ncbi:MAG: DUF1501 domain-containing protein, partial [Planctomycetales bacterium]|nr:DUF1501 domain-containing protein [Planctomycetales bacterium]